MIRPDKNLIYPVFLYMLVWQDEFFDHMMSTAKGIKMPRGDVHRILDLDVPLPPMEEQKKCAEKFVRALDDFEDAQKGLESLKTERMNLFNRLFDSDNKTHADWPILPLGELGEFRNGINYRREDKGVSIRCVGVGDFQDRRILSDKDSVSEINLQEVPSKEALLESGDFLFVRSNGSRNLVGRCLRVDANEKTPMVYSGFCIRFRPNGSINKDYLLTLLRSDKVRRQLIGEGSNIQNIDQRKLSSIGIPMPPMTLQEEYAQQETLLATREQNLRDRAAGALEEAQTLLDKNFR